MAGRDPLARMERLFSEALNRLLRNDEERARRLARLEGSVLELCVRDTQWRAYVFPTVDGIGLRRQHAGRVDVRITGRPADFIAYARASRRGDAFGVGRIEISGDLAVAQNVQTLLADLAIDWEDAIAPYIGEVPAHQFARLARRATALIGGVAARLEADVADYLHFEARLAPTRTEIEALGRAISGIADDVDRLEARLRRLARAPRRT